MTNPTLERAARALYEFGMMADCPTWEQFEPRYKEDFFDMARAVLMAVRSADIQTIQAGAYAYDDERAIKPVWEAMIDTILAGGGE